MDVYVEDTIRPAQSATKTIISREAVLDWLRQPSQALQKGLIEHFDSTIGRTTVLLPFGGKTQMTEVDASVQKLPIRDRDTNTVSIMTVGGNPAELSISPYRGAYLAVVEALAKTTAVGGDISKTKLSMQEYFRRLGKDPRNWGMVLQALLGALQAQADFHTPAIGGKDSMSGTFQDRHVPPTLLVFALTQGLTNQIISPEFKSHGNYVYLYLPLTDEAGLPNPQDVQNAYRLVHEKICNHIVISAAAIKAGGWIEAVVKIGFRQPNRL
jgi:phosphoribosylformylglycinamidine synthase